jgi:hypothetical protein
MGKENSFMWEQSVEEKRILAHSSICFGVIHTDFQKKGYIAPRYQKNLTSAPKDIDRHVSQ